MKRYINLIGLLALASTLILGVLGLFSHVHLIFDLASHFRVHYAITACVASIIFLFYRAHWLALLSIVSLAFNLAFVVPWYFGSKETASKEDIKIFLSNVLTNNSDHGRLVSLIQNVSPDIIVVMEINNSWVNALNVLENEYSYSKLAPREDNFGIGVYSKLPIIMGSVKYFGSSGVPSIVLSLEAAKGTLTLVATHPVPPIGDDYFKSRNKQLSHVAKEAEKISGPFILAGDLNTTMWSSHYSQLEKNGKLRNVRRGFGINATWPSGLGILGIPIDHVLISDEIRVVDVRVGASVGSDHLPLIIELSIIGSVSAGT
ncbi:Uncharacterized conserved protein YafD, endonuclease/exonuclease/phosphatase (EEP) superfamily [Alteromonadaceae bacterium Bs31]|nr:Uncharacterized conserved protein YafD, endonuclease/exonuclease/phosphatase (EEP) superfamily [Alteromonadaceae bacterium Bs31]